VRPVVGEPGPGQVPPRNAFDRHHVQALAQQLQLFCDLVEGSREFALRRDASNRHTPWRFAAR
jgi:hypothetical protein